MRVLILICWTLCCILFIVGCSSTDELATHSLEDRTVAILSDMPEAPFVDFDMTIFDRVGSNESPAFESPTISRRPGRPVIPPIVVGSPVETDPLDATPRTPVHRLIDSVLVTRPMSDQIISYVEARGIQQFRFSPSASSNEADYLLKIEVEDYGIGADSWETPVYYELIARVTLIEQESGKPIWQDEIESLSTMPKALLKAGLPQGNAETPALLSQKTHEEMTVIIDALARFSADQLTSSLREAYQQTIPRETAYTVSD